MGYNAMYGLAIGWPPLKTFSIPPSPMPLQNHFIDPKCYHRSGLSSCLINYLGECWDEEEEEENDADEVVDCREEAADSTLVHLAWLNALLLYITLFSAVKKI